LLNACLDRLPVILKVEDRGIVCVDQNDVREALRKLEKTQAKKQFSYDSGMIAQKKVQSSAKSKSGAVN
jgi:hypothetical protein